MHFYQVVLFLSDVVIMLVMVLTGIFYLAFSKTWRTKWMWIIGQLLYTCLLFTLLNPYEKSATKHIPHLYLERNYEDSYAITQYDVPLVMSWLLLFIIVIEVNLLMFVLLVRRSIRNHRHKKKQADEKESDEIEK